MTGSLLSNHIRLLSREPNHSIMTLAEAKTHLRVSFNDDDSIISGLILAVESFLEGVTGQPIISSNYAFEFFNSLGSKVITIPSANVSSIVSVSLNDTVLTEADYSTEIYPDYSLICIGVFTPRNFKIRIAYKAGYSPSASIPADLKQAALMMLSHWYKNDSAVSEKHLFDAPLAVQTIVSRYRAGGF